MIWLLAATIRVSAILLFALVLARLLRKRTASLRHTAVLIGMTCAAIVPLLGAVVPPWAVRAVTLPPGLHTLSIPDRPVVPDGAHVPAPNIGVLAAKAATQLSGPSPEAASHQWQRSLPRILDIAWVVYLVGLVVSLAALAVGLLQLYWMSARSVPVCSMLWQRQAAAIAAAYGLQRPVRLARSSHQAVLAVWGFARPQVLLPIGAENWAEDRIRAVLLHEFAHIRRNDWLVQVLAGMLRAIYWFNPLLWFTCACLRQESEHACDDYAIGQGVGATEYATHLLALARAFTQPPMLAPAPSMARRSTLMRRVADILDPATTHARASRGSMARVAAALLAITLAVAACQIKQSSLQGPDARLKQVATRPHRNPDLPAIVAESRDFTGRVPIKSGMTGERSAVTGKPAGVPRDSAALPGTSPLRLEAAGREGIERAAMADVESGQLMDYTHVPEIMGSVQRMVEDDGHGPAGMPGESAALTIAEGSVSLPDRSRPPTVVASTGGFTIRRLTAPMVTDRRNWNSVSPIWGGTAVAPNRQFAVSLSNQSDEGNAARYRIAYSDIGSKPVKLTADVATYAWVTPDSRWIFLENLNVIDVRTWRRYLLSQQFGIASYAVPKAISTDGRRLILSRSSCPFDCGNVPEEYYELGFPDLEE